jgi:CelD/BcsL family acetyltransferase involved in cellulose biosynthesis
MMNTSGIRIEWLSTAGELTSLREAWNALARGVAFRSYDWLECWWQCYGVGTGKQLLVLAAFDEHGQLVGLAPWYIEPSAPSRHVIRFLGSGEVCSDYLTILCREGCEEMVTLALADWLCPPEGSASHAPLWQRLELGGIDQGDLPVSRLLERLEARGNLVHRRRRSSCWRVRLPADWDAYLATLSKSHRKQIRRLERHYFQTGRAQLHIARTPGELERGLERLAQLHQRRRESLGERGCFSSTQFAAFHRQTARRLLDSGSLRLVWLTVDGRTVAGEYQVLGDGVVYAYQSGIEPDALEHEPGRLITVATLRMAIAEGRRAFDFLRGDESYKAHWRALPRLTQDIRVVSLARGARLRHNLWLASDHVKSWIKNRLKLSGVIAH